MDDLSAPQQQQYEELHVTNPRLYFSHMHQQQQQQQQYMQQHSQPPMSLSTGAAAVKQEAGGAAAAQQQQQQPQDVVRLLHSIDPTALTEQPMDTQVANKVCVRDGVFNCVGPLLLCRLVVAGLVCCALAVFAACNKLCITRTVNSVGNNDLCLLLLLLVYTTCVCVLFCRCSMSCVVVRRLMLRAGEAPPACLTSKRFSCSDRRCWCVVDRKGSPCPALYVCWIVCGSRTWAFCCKALCTHCRLLSSHSLS